MTFGTWKPRGIKLNTWEYGSQRLNEIVGLNKRIESNGIYITDIMPVYNANNPVFQLESGQ